MCPICFTTIMLMAAGATSTGGLTMLAVRKRQTRASARNPKPTMQPKENPMNHPPIVSREEWLLARKALLAKEKELTHQRDAVNTERRKLPMVKLDKNYVFDGPGGKFTLLDLFGPHRQLIVYHFMFDPAWEEGCPACSFVTDNIGHRSHLHARDTELVLVSRAPLAKLLKFKKRMGWSVPWYSSFGSGFNYDFHVTHDEKIRPVEYNYQTKAGLLAAGAPDFADGEAHGVSVFLRVGDDVFHTYSTYARGCDVLLGTYNYLDLTALGRQEDWEQPPGRGNGPFMGWLRYHDKYEEPTKTHGSCRHCETTD